MIVIGAGPGGYVAAIRAAQLGLKVACVEKEALGGTCLNVGCIPSKALLDASERYYEAKHTFARRGIKIEGSISVDLPTMMSRKSEVVKSLVNGVGFLFKKNRIEHVKGSAKITAPGKVSVVAAGASPRELTGKNIIIATGSSPSVLPSLPYDGKFILSSTEILALDSIPKRLLVVGGGYIGVEMSSVWSRLGTEVLVVEFLDRILPQSDREMALALQKSLEKQGLKFRFKTAVTGAKVEGDRVRVTFKSGDETGEELVDKVLVSVGRRPHTEGLGLAEVGVKMDARGFVIADEKFLTSVPGIYAIGDVIGGIMLAHKAEEEGVAVAENLAGKHGHVNYAACPSVVYTHPELAAVGLTEDAAAARGEIKVGKFNIAANGRAKGMDQTEGFIKVIADAKTDRLLGVHIFSAHASDMIAEATVAMEFAASAEDLARSFHAHPTLPEALKEAAMAVNKHAIHA